MPVVRRRRPRACDGCFHRKIRCDDRPGPCRNCETYKIECKATRADGSIVNRSTIRPSQDLTPPQTFVHEDSTPSTTRPFTAQDSHIARDIAGSITNRDHAHQHAPSIPPQTTPAHLSRATPDVYWEHPPRHHSPSSTPLVTTPTVYGLSNDSLQGVVTIEPKSAPTRSKYAGKNSTQVLAKSAEELFQDDQIRIRVMDFFCPLMSFAEDIPTTSFSSCPILERDLAYHYVEAYFASINQLFPILSEAQFRPQLDEFYDVGQSSNAVFICALNMVLALGAQTCHDDKSFSNLFACGWDLFGRVMSTPYLPSVQALLLMTVALMSCNKDGQAIFSVGSAVRMAQSIGLHRGLSAHKQPRERDFVEKDYNLRTRIWWICYCLDKKLSFETGRPSVVNDAECDADPPLTNLLTPGSSIMPPENELFFEQFIHLCRVQSQIVSRLFCTRVYPNQELLLIQDVEAVDALLLEWKRNLPLSLHIDEQLIGAQDQGKSTGCILLHCMYYNTMLVVHRAALFGTPPLQMDQHNHRRMASADVVCLNSARSLSKSLNELVGRQHSSSVVRWTTNYILNALFTLYVGIMKSPLHWSADLDIALIKTLRTCFCKSNTTFFAISSFDALLDSLCNAIATAQRRSRNQHIGVNSELEQSRDNGHEQQEGILDGSNNTTDLGGMGTGFLFSDFFGTSDDSETLAAMQLWPIDLGQSLNSLGEYPRGLDDYGANSI